jgi:hypothetical protein
VLAETNRKNGFQARSPIKLFFDNRAINDLTLSQISKDAHVTLILRGTTKVAQVNVQAPTMRPILKAIDVRNGKVTVHGEGREQTFTLSDKANVLVGGQLGNVRDVMPGMRVTLALSLDRRQVIGIISPGSGEE